jgi:hypothetical protein
MQDHFAALRDDDTPVVESGAMKVHLRRIQSTIELKCLSYRLEIARTLHVIVTQVILVAG